MTNASHINSTPYIHINAKGIMLEKEGNWNPYFITKTGALGEKCIDLLAPFAQEALKQSILDYKAATPTLFNSPQGIFRFIAKPHATNGWIISLQQYQTYQSKEPSVNAWEDNTQRLSLLMKATQSGVYDRDLSTGKVWRNQAFYKLLNYDPEPLNQNTQWWLSLVKAEERASIEDRLQWILTHKQEQFTLEYQAKASNGQYKHLVDKGNIVYDEQGTPIRVTGIIGDVTKTKQAEALLRESEKKFASVFSSAPVSIMIFRLSDGNILDVNEHFLTTLGFGSKGDVLGKKAGDLTIWKDLRVYARVVKKLTKVGAINKEKILLRSFNNESIHIQVYGKIIHLKKEPYAVTIFHNTTDYVLAEKSLIEQEARFKGIFENAGIGIAMTNLIGRILESNTFLIDLLGYTKEEVSQKTIFSLLAPHHRREQKRHFLQVVKTREQYLKETEIEFQHKDGSLIWGQLKVSLIWGNGRKPLYGVVMIEDISERKLAEAKAQESQELLKTINNNVNDGIFRSAIEQGVVYANQAFIDMLGYDSFEEINQVPTLDLYKDPSQQAYLLKKLAQDGFLRNEEVLLQRKDGSSFWALFNCLISVKEEGVSYFDGAIVDISEQKKAKDLLQSQNEELEKINAELDRFVYSASHDLRAPLTSLLGLLEVIRMYNEDGQLNQYFDMMQKSITKLDLFIREIVNYSRNTRAEVCIEKIDFQEIIDNTFSNLQYIQGIEKIQTSIEIEQSEDFYSDPSRLAPIFSNLISNAIRYHKFNQDYQYIRISVKVSHERVVVKVEDNGLGIEEIHIAHIFEMFYRATEEAKGSGLGLYIVKESLDKLHGEIKVESKVNRGTTFTFSIPNRKNNAQ